jgi:hypothetical protein
VTERRQGLDAINQARPGAYVGGISIDSPDGSPGQQDVALE